MCNFLTFSWRFAALCKNKQKKNQFRNAFLQDLGTMYLKCKYEKR